MRTLVLTALVAAALLAGSVSAQRGATPPAVAAPAAARKPVPRAANGKPDLSGIWIANGALRLAASEEELRAIQAADQALGRKPPARPEPLSYKPEAEARRQYYLNRRGIDDPMALCLMSGVPRITGRPLPFEIVQLPDRVIILYEVHHAFRIIPTDGRPHPEDIEPTYLGDSTGRWDGDTLVVDVVGFNDRTWLAGVGTIHSEKLHVVERYTRDTHDTIRYEVTVEDPEVLTKPWRTEETLRLRPNERIREYECIENNEDLQRIQRLLQDEKSFVK